MRIIAGEFRRRQLLANPGQVTRPITDRVKEILFERIQGKLAGKRIADVFAGTGSLGLEALSRGAERVVLIEGDRRAFDLLRRNVAALKVEERAFCWRTDVARTSFRPRGVDAFLPYDVVFFDPPHALAEQLVPESPLGRALVRLARPEVTAAEAVLYFRGPQGLLPRCPACWLREQTLPISSMDIHVFCKRTGSFPSSSAGAT